MKHCTHKWRSSELVPIKKKAGTYYLRRYYCLECTKLVDVQLVDLPIVVSFKKKVKA